MPKSHSLKISKEPGGTTQKGNKDTSHRTIIAGNRKGKEEFKGMDGQSREHCHLSKTESAQKS